ncbi:MAG: BMP family ABC transporter substrate-binding protein [Muribaculaceae bacterium]|nr:BMP family ABC transporter substrate-binding protein [Muribaculaceae bacterium]
MLRILHYIQCILVLLLSIMIPGCNSEDIPIEDEVTPQIIFLFSPGGLGDMSYNDCILEGVQQFKKQNPVIDIYIYSPNSLEEAERIFSDWLIRPESNIPVLFTLASSDYEPMAEKYLKEHSLTANKSILLFESRKRYADEKIHTFQISMFGASYLAGVVAWHCAAGKKSLVLLANDSDGPIAVAKDGFIAGYGSDCDIQYLADDWTGYVSAALAYRNMSTWSLDYGYIFPVAGGSNAGIYRYSREFDDAPFLAGMDIDQSSLSTKITGSVIKRIDVVICHYLTEWVQTGVMPDSQLYGLADGYSDWLLAPLYGADFNEIVENSRRQAIAMEKAYYENNEI